MDNYIVSARKYRPMTFDSVVGQKALTTTLKNAVKSGKLAHAYLFCGPRGVGKTTCARIFAKAINCENPTADGEACNECESCKAFNEGRSFNIFELDAASNNSVENIRSLMEQTRIPPQVGRYKVFIIDEVHMLSTAAFNAFLKTLEEPPAHVIFILCTTEKNKVLPTILSRCQIYDFERMTVPNTVEHLKMVAQKEGIKYEEQALEVIAEKADGGMRDALSIFDQAASFSQGDITYQKVIEDLNVLDADNYFNIIDLALANKVADIMVLLNNVVNKGFDAGNLINGLASHVRNVLMAKDPQTLPLLEISDRQRQRYQEQAKKCPANFLYKALQIMNRCDVEYRQSSNKRLLVELTLIEIAQITQPDDKDVPAAGRSPRRLKSLFKLLVPNKQPKPAAQVAGAASSLSPRASQRQHTEGAVAGASTESVPSSSTPVSDKQDSATSNIQHSKLNTQHLNFGSLGLSFDNLLKEKNKKPEYVQDYEITNKDEKTKFSQADLEREWRAMCVRMENSAPGQAQRLKNIHPVITQYPDIEIAVDNKILLDEIKPIQRRLRATMAKYLHNGNIQFSIRLARQEEIKPMLTPLENYEQMKKDNPAINSLVEQLGLELA